MLSDSSTPCTLSQSVKFPSSLDALLFHPKLPHLLSVPSCSRSFTHHVFFHKLTSHPTAPEAFLHSSPFSHSKTSKRTMRSCHRCSWYRKDRSLVSLRSGATATATLLTSMQRMATTSAILALSDIQDKTRIIPSRVPGYSRARECHTGTCTYRCGTL